jgi:MFS family permease
MTSGAMPFVLPLYFQLGFGLPAFSAGLLVFAYAAGNLGMKAITTRLLRAFGFRRLLIANGLLVAVFILAVTITGPGTPRSVLIALLFLAGCFRSLQHTSINTLTFADVPPEQRSSATTLSIMFQQLSFSVGIAVGASVLALSAFLGGRVPGDLALGDFRVTFVVLALLALGSALRFTAVGSGVGDEVSGYQQKRQVERSDEGSGPA